MIVDEMYAEEIAAALTNGLPTSPEDYYSMSDEEVIEAHGRMCDELVMYGFDENYNMNEYGIGCMLLIDRLADA